MERHQIEIEVRPGGEVHVSIQGVSPTLCKRYKQFFARILQTTDEEVFLRLPAPVEPKERLDEHEHLQEGQ
ncbi:MAG: hypothetical protein KBE04_04515 [Phycisphaerae bacterium]|nr:hypothetical protein [Phycisphaerae bacterium]